MCASPTKRPGLTSIQFFQLSLYTISLSKSKIRTQSQDIYRLRDSPRRLFEFDTINKSVLNTAFWGLLCALLAEWGNLTCPPKTDPLNNLVWWAKGSRSSVNYLPDILQRQRNPKKLLFRCSCIHHKSNIILIKQLNCHLINNQD